MLVVYAGLLVLITLAIGITVLAWLLSSSDDRLAVIANLLAFGTLLLALVAGIVALAAFSAATGLPSLRLRINKPITQNDTIIFVGGDSKKYATSTFGTIVIPGNDNIVRISVKNTTKYAARTPAVTIEFKNAAILQNMYAVSSGWTATELDYSMGGVQALQWDGGPNYAIHGNSTRHLPEINLQGLYPEDGWDQVQIIVKLLADGYNRPEIILSVDFLTEGAKAKGWTPSWL
jgi:hypothetical protein